MDDKNEYAAKSKMLSMVERADGPVKDSQLDSALNQLEKDFASIFLALGDLNERLIPVSTGQSSEMMGDDEDSYGTSRLLRRLRDFHASARSIDHTVRSLTRELEI